MKKYMKTVLIVLVCIAITAIPAAFILTNFVLYTPLYDRIPEIKNMGNCTKIGIAVFRLVRRGPGSNKDDNPERKGGNQSAGRSAFKHNVPERAGRKP